MTPKGVSDIRGLRSLTTSPGLISESKAHLKLYHLTAEKAHLQRKRAWVRRQDEQTEKRLADIALAIHKVEERAQRGLSSHPYPGFRRPFIQY